MSKKKRRGFTGMQLFTSCISTTMVLVLIGLVVFFMCTARSLSDSVKENLTVTLLLNDDATSAEIKRYEAYLGTEAFVNKVVYVSKEQALKEQTEAMGSDPTEFLGANPFSATMEITLNADYANSDSLCWITGRFKSGKPVSDVVYQQDLMDNLNENLRKLGFVLLLLASLLMFVSFGLISSTIRLSIYSHRFLIHTMKLVGANWGFIRRPFVWRSMGIGLVSAVLANVLLVGGIQALVRYDAALAEYMTVRNEWIMVGSVAAFGLLMTLLCSYVSVNRYLRMREDEMYEV
ncbi:MAG: permease-like cell division protein FtsX [Clostridium sp.]|nr:permease-like cell division protein FtsX [Clostridium sp.]